MLNAHLLWDPDTGELIGELDGEARVFSPDGLRFAGIRGAPSGAADGHIELVVWDTATGSELDGWPVEVRGALNLQFSPLGDRVVLTSANESWAKVWNALTGDLVATLCCPANPYQAVFSPDGRRVLTQSQQDGLGVWDLDGNELVNLRPAATPYTVAWSPDGRVIAAALEDGSIQLWEAHPWGDG